MGRSETSMNEQAEGFWDRFLERIRKQGIKEPFGRWQVIRAEQFIKASGKPLADLTVEDVHRYLEEAGRKGNLKEWQFRQVVDATQNLLLTAEAACTEQVDWDYWRDFARSLEPNHATVARENLLEEQKAATPDTDKPSLLDSIRHEHRQVISSLIMEIRRRGYSIRTEQAYELWVCRFIAFCGTRDPRRLGAAEVVSFLEHIAVRRRVSVSTQNQALNALVFLYGQVLNSPLGEFGNFVRAKRPKRLPTVLSRQEVGRLLAGMEGVRYLMAARSRRMRAGSEYARMPLYPIAVFSESSMAQYIYTMNRVGKVVPPKREILRDISLSFFPGAKIGVLGLNGAGKSSLLRIMAGLDQDYNGEARPQPDIRIGYLPQEPQLDPKKDVRGNVEQGVAQSKALVDRFNAVSMKFAEPMSDDEMNALMAEQAHLQDAIDAAGAWDLDRKLEIAANALRLPPWDTDVSKLSGGERRRVALCQLLLSAPDMLLLDEPTNHLDAESVAWLERFLQDYPGTVIAVTHDRYFLDNVAGWILELDRGYGIPWEGNYSSWLEQKEKRLEIEEKQASSRQRTIKAELEWVRSNQKGRHAKSKARLARFEELASQDFQKRNETQELYIPPGPRLGERVVEAKHLVKGFGERLLIEGLDFHLPRGGIVGIIGPNGAGKTTLFRMICGQEVADAGELHLGETVKLAAVDQSRDTLDGAKTVWEEIADGQDIITVGKFEMPSRAYVSRFNFRGQDQQKRVKDLSGGERNRVHLAKLLKSGGNVLLLDEPTNDLDVETLRALEEALLAFPGCAVVISHDRWFLDRIATHILAFEGESQVIWFEGNYADYEADRHRRLGVEADQPHRIKYKKLA